MIKLKKNVLAFVYLVLAALFAVSCDWDSPGGVGTQNWPTELPARPFDGLSAIPFNDADGFGVRFGWRRLDNVRGYEVERNIVNGADTVRIFFALDASGTKILGLPDMDGMANAGAIMDHNRRIALFLDSVHTDTFFVDRNVENGTQYQYRVRGWNGAGAINDKEDEGGWSSWIRVRTDPARVIGLDATTFSSRRIDLAWSTLDSAGNPLRADKFVIYRTEGNPEDDDPNKVKEYIDTLKAKIVGETAGGSNYEHQDTIEFRTDGDGIVREVPGLKANTWYNYWVRAVNEVPDPNTPGRTVDRPGRFSKIASDKTKLAPPAWVDVKIVSAPTAERPLAENVEISWAKVDGAKGYEIYFETGNANATFTFPIAIDSVGFATVTFPDKEPQAGLQHVDERFVFGLIPGTQLRYAVRGVDKFAKTDGTGISGKYIENLTGDFRIGFAQKITPPAP